MRERGKIGEEAWEMTTVDLISDFVTTSLVRLSPGKLRTAYAQHAAECFVVLTEASHKTKSSVDHERRLKELIARVIDGVVHDVTSTVCTQPPFSVCVCKCDAYVVGRREMEE